nr:epithelial splicing regulatory protein 1 [Hymenolepis microstoma]
MYFFRAFLKSLCTKKNWEKPLANQPRRKGSLEVQLMSLDKRENLNPTPEPGVTEINTSLERLSTTALTLPTNSLAAVVLTWRYCLTTALETRTIIYRKMALKRNFPEAPEASAKIPKLAESKVDYLLPIEFVSSGSCPCIIQITAALFCVKERKSLFQCSVSVGNSNSQPSTGNHFTVTSFQEALTELTLSVERHCPLSDVTMLTKGHKGIRNGLHHEMIHARVKQSISANSFWWKYFEIEQFSPNDDCNKARTPLTTVEWMCKVVEKYLLEGDPFGKPQQIKPLYIHAIIPERTVISPGTVAEMHQLPWTATPYTIAVFFRGLNIRPGGIAIKIAEGRRSNTAYIAFESNLDAQLACERTTQEDYDVLANLEMSSLNQNNRPNSVQIAMASEALFLQYAECRYPDIANFLQQLTDEKQIVVRIRGLPYTTKKSDILKFFKQVDAKILNEENGIFFATHADCRPTGDAFVLFVDNLNADRALTRHRNYLGQRYVELFKASPSEAVQVCQSAQKIGISGSNMIPGLVNKLFRPQSAGLTIPDPISTIPINSAITTAPISVTGLPGNLTLQNITAGLINPFLINPSLLTMPLTANIPMMSELNDPTDPKSLFPRPLPPGGARFILQIMDLPATYSRQDMRLFLGMDMFAKIYRMCKITTCLTDDSWLLLFAEFDDAVWAMEQLIRRPPVMGVLPRFILFEIDSRDFQLNLVRSSQMPRHFLSTRVLNMQMQVDSSIRQSVPQVSGQVGFETQLMSTTAASVSTSSLFPQQSLQQLPLRLTLDTNVNLSDFANSCILQLTGLPRNVTQQELTSLYAPITSLISSSPQFLPLPPNGQETTLTYLAIFANRTDAALALTHCRLGTLRDNTFIVLTTPTGLPSPSQYS